MPLLISVFLFVQIINMHAIQSSLVTVNDSTFSGLSPLFPRSQSSPTPKSFIRTFPSTRLPPSRHSSQLTRLNTNPAPALFSLLLILFFFFLNQSSWSYGVLSLFVFSQTFTVRQSLHMFVVGYDLVVLWLCLFLSLVSACLFISVFIHTCVCEGIWGLFLCFELSAGSHNSFFISMQLRLNQVARSLLLISAPCILASPLHLRVAHLYLIFLYPATPLAVSLVVCLLSTFTMILS